MNGVDYSLNATYCGATAAAVTGNIGGYLAAKSLCETVCNSTSAHMCDGLEMVRSEQLGITTATGWISTGGYVYYDSLLVEQRDCLGWTSSSSNQLGPLWASGWPGNENCPNARPVLCCD